MRPAADRRYDQSEKGRARKRRYNQSEAGRASKRKWKEKKLETDPIWRLQHYDAASAYSRARRLREFAERVERSLV